MRLRNVAVAFLLGILMPLGLMAATPPKVLIIYDMEGVSSVVAPAYERYAPTPEYAEGRKALTADVNAAVRGLKEGGAGAIWVQDGHGSGNDQGPDLLVKQLDPRARFDFRDYPYDPYSTGLDGSLDAIVCIGMHARSRTPGFLAHTDTFNVDWNVNGVEFTETHIVALSAARWGIPVIMVSGDNVLEGQLKKDFPQLQYAVVKTAKSLTSAEPLPPGEAQQRIEAAARRAMQMFLAGKFQPYYLPPPYHFILSFPNAEQGRFAAASSAVTPDSPRAVQFTRPTFIQGYHICQRVIRRAADPYPMLLRVLQHDPQGARFIKEWKDLIWQQFDLKSMPPWALPPPSRPAKAQRYYGDS
jgi:D-amino peptidase